MMHGVQVSDLHEPRPDAFHDFLSRL
jgi:hypothetical protein